MIIVLPCRANFLPAEIVIRF